VATFVLMAIRLRLCISVSFAFAKFQIFEKAKEKFINFKFCFSRVDQLGGPLPFWNQSEFVYESPVRDI